ncbi:MAG: aminotransferase class I/II-fold pyridoxal phosphate-dependent enzyme [Desulfobacteraceae bacterium]|nr:MAG: aminotransferase class I/II-fold pyridoxal phosphate-dependent enzyme [Desulfobacteraceae bacterium]
MTDTTLIADRMDNLGDETAFKVGDDIRRAEENGLDVIRLNLGEPDFSSPENINAVAIENIRMGNANYCDPQGIMPLRESIARYVHKTRQVEIDPDQVVVTSGGKPPIGYSVLTYVNAGDEVIYPNPGFPIYESWIRYVNAVPRPLTLREDKNFRFDIEDLKPLISRKTKLIILNSPSNPTGGMLTQDDLDAIADLAARNAHPHFRILSDEVYEKIIFDSREHISILSNPRVTEHTILMNSHSKTYAMTGWRIGYAVLPTIEEARLFRQWNINTCSCVPPFIQAAAQQAIDDPANDTEVAQMTQQFETRRDAVIQALNEIPGICCMTPGGAFYAFPNISGICQALGILEHYERLREQGLNPIQPASMFQLFLIYHHGVATVDRSSFGSLFCENEHYIRLSLASDLDTLEEGVRRIGAASSDTEGWAQFKQDYKDLICQ